MSEYWEKGFTQKVQESFVKLKNQNYTLKVINDKKFLTNFEESCKIVDAVMIRGLSVDREENMHPSEYKKF
jgi:hypothetical protein